MSQCYCSCGSLTRNHERGLYLYHSRPCYKRNLHTDYSLGNGPSNRRVIALPSTPCIVQQLLAEPSATSLLLMPRLFLLPLLPLLIPRRCFLLCIFLQSFGRPRFFFVVVAAGGAGEAGREAAREGGFARGCARRRDTTAIKLDVYEGCKADSDRRRQELQWGHARSLQ